MPDVLVVDDDPDIRMLVQFALENVGITVRTAGDGAEALVAIDTKAPDAVVLDVMMPGTDGISVLQRVRARRSLDRVKVLMLTTKVAERDQRRGWETGADEYVTKPFDPVLLAERVQPMLHTSSDALVSRRQAEVDKAELLHRLELASNKAKGDRPSTGGAARLLRAPDQP